MPSVITNERNEINISMIKKILSKEKSKRFKMNVYIQNNSRRVVTIRW